MRIVCVPVAAKNTCGPGEPHPLSLHPEPCIDVSEGPACTTNSAELAVSIRIVAAPLDVTASLNWTWTESLPIELFWARRRTQTWYAVPFSARNFASA